jgi:hypothetical protein
LIAPGEPEGFGTRRPARACPAAHPRFASRRLDTPISAFRSEQAGRADHSRKREPRLRRSVAEEDLSSMSRSAED